MGLEVGFDVWDKKDGKLVKHELSEEEHDKTWVCGRCDVTYAWDYGTSTDYEGRVFTSVVFDKEFDGYTEKDPKYESTRVLKYIPFDEFKAHIMESVDEEIKNLTHAKHAAWVRIAEMKSQIKEYQELQLKSTTDFVFDKFQEKIEEARSNIKEDQDYIDTVEEEDYDYTHAIAVRDMLGDMEKYIKEGLVVTTFFSD